MGEAIDNLAVFAGEEFYSAGGASNLIGWAGSEDEAWLLVDRFGRHLGSGRISWCHALDVTTGRVIRRHGWFALGHGEVANSLIDWKVF